MKGNTSRMIYNFLYFLGIVLLVVVMFINWIMDWEVQYLFWIPVGTWLLAMPFALIATIIIRPNEQSFIAGAKWRGEQISNEIKRIMGRAMNDEGRDLCNYILSFIEKRYRL